MTGRLLAIVLAIAAAAALWALIFNGLTCGGTGCPLTHP